MIPDMQALANLDRIRAIAAYDLFNPQLQEQLDDICRRTATRVGTPTSMVSIVLDTAQYFAGAHGLAGWIAASRGTPLEWAFCAHAVLSGQRTYVVPDATAHPAHADSPLVTGEGTRAYAGVPITAPDGQILGMHCVTTTSPRPFTDDDLAALREATDEILDILAAYRSPEA